VTLLEIIFNFIMSAFAVAYLRFIILKKNKANKKKLANQPSQSKNLSSFNDRVLQILEEQKPKKTQASQYISRNSVKAIAVEDQIYWIADNAFYTANIVDGDIQENSTRLVDTMAMDKVQLEKMIFIVDKLREGE
jgi:hypothetical protein